MVPLDIDGNIDVERINQLPIDEKFNLIGEMTEKQYEYYCLKSPACAPGSHTKAIAVNYTMEDEIERGTAVDIDKYLREWRAELDKRK